MRSRHFITAIGYIILLRIVDLAITFIYTPNLRYEWNPIVSVFEYSWMGMLVTQVFIISLIIFVMSFYFNKQPTLKFPSDLSFNDFLHFYFFNQKKSKSKRWYKVPKRNIRRVLAYNGFILMTLAMAVSYLAIINNLMVIGKVQSYSMFISKYGNLFYPIILIGLAILSFYAFFIMEYRLYKKNIAKVIIN